MKRASVERGEQSRGSWAKSWDEGRRTQGWRAFPDEAAGQRCESKAVRPSCPHLYAQVGSLARKEISQDREGKG